MLGLTFNYAPCIFDINSLSTPGESHATNYIGDIDLTGRTYVDFKVKASNDAHVLLTFDDGSNFEVQLGGWANTNSAIRTTKGDLSTTFVSRDGAVVDLG